MTARGLSARRACRLLHLSRSSFSYRTAPDKNENLAGRLRDLAEKHPRAGCRMAWAWLREDFAPLNLKRVRRIWKREGLHLKAKKRARLKGIPKPILWAVRTNQVWCMDFAHDSCASGRKIKCFALVDEASRECIALEAHTSIAAKRVVEVLEEAFARFGKPDVIRCDNGPEFASLTLRLFLRKEGVRLVFVQPASPWQNGFAESFIGTFRSECLDAEVFANLADAQIKIAMWRNFYNDERPHSSIGYIQPRKYREKMALDQIKCKEAVTL